MIVIGCLVYLRQGQFNSEPCARTGGAGDLNPAAVMHNDPFGECQPQPGSTLETGAVYLIETVKYFIKIPGVNPFAAIGDNHHSFIVGPQ